MKNEEFLSHSMLSMMQKFISVHILFIPHRNVLSILLICRALSVFQASPRLSYTEGSLIQQRALAHLVKANN